MSPALEGEERFLQHIISRTLDQKTPAETDAAESPQPQPSSRSHTPYAVPTAPSAAANQIPSELTTATTTMILALSAILSLLGAGGYVIRRYLLKPSVFGKRGNLLRVVARVSITPKAAVALLEVPGKLLVIGVNGSTLTALGEIPATALEQAESVENTTSDSFAAALDQHAQAANASAPPEDPLVHMAEHIQRKVSRLKQL
jgi:flagellar biogenesis protein FliO